MSQLSEALKSFDTGYLTKAKNELIHAIPGDATFTSHVGMILRALLTHELGQRAQAAPSANTGIVPQKLAEEPVDPPPPEWTDPAPPNEPPPPPPTPSTRATPPPPPNPQRPPRQDW